jgi:hypothetical protein
MDKVQKPRYLKKMHLVFTCFKLLPEIFLDMINIQRVTRHMLAHTSVSPRVSGMLLLTDSDQNWKCDNTFRQSHQYQNFMKILLPLR